MAENFDLVVVGGGPAGLAVAIGARIQGLTAAVLDQRHPPIDRACGEGIMPDGIELLHSLDVSPPPEGSSPFRGIRYIDGGTVAEGFFPGAPGYGIRRTHLHRALVERAEDVGVDLPVVVRLEGTNRDEGKALLAASGLSIIAAEGFTDAARKVVQASRESAA